MHKKFTHNVKVYYEDTDAGGVVYYANYLKYLERARTEALSTIGLSNTKIKNDFGALIIVKSCNIQYKIPVLTDLEYSGLLMTSITMVASTLLRPCASNSSTISDLSPSGKLSISLPCTNPYE